jgi:glucokinase
MTSPNAVLLGDIGATNARFAICLAGKVSPIEWIDVASHPHFSDALGHVLFRFDRAKVTGAILAVAGPVDGESCHFTNCTWSIDGALLCNRFGFKSVHLVNDFYATAKSLPLLEADHLFTLGNGRPLEGAPRVVLGPGSGLGVAGLISDGTVVTSEGGHATFPGASRREDAILDYIREQYGHVSAERVLSGPGIENLYTAISHVDGMPVPPRHAVQITNAALSDECPVSVATIDLFCAWLGSFAGNVALMFGARGGVYIAGGIVPRIVNRLERSDFRRRFEDKGRLRAYLKPVATRVIVHPTASFLGLRLLAEQHLHLR